MTAPLSAVSAFRAFKLRQVSDPKAHILRGQEGVKDEDQLFCIAFPMPRSRSAAAFPAYVGCYGARIRRHVRFPQREAAETQRTITWSTELEICGISTPRPRSPYEGSPSVFSLAGAHCALRFATKCPKMRNSHSHVGAELL